MRVFLLFILLPYSYNMGFSHGDLHAQIEEVTQLISLYPEDKELLLQRAELLLRHEDYRAARSDLKRILKSSPATNDIFWMLAVANHHLGKTRLSDHFLHRISTAKWTDDHLILSAKNLLHRKQFEKAVRVFEMVIAQSSTPAVPRFLDLSDACVRAGDPDRAILVLENGVTLLGLIPALYQPLMKLLIAEKKFSQALTWQSKIVATQVRKEFALLSRARLWLATGQTSAAVQDIKTAERLILKLPVVQLNQPKTQDCLRRLQDLHHKLIQSDHD